MALIIYAGIPQGPKFKFDFYSGFNQPVSFGPIGSPIPLLHGRLPTFVFGANEPWDAFFVRETAYGRIQFVTTGRGLNHINVASRGILTFAPVFIDIPGNASTTLKQDIVCMSMPWGMRIETGATNSQKWDALRLSQYSVDDKDFEKILVSGWETDVLMLAKNPELTRSQFEALSQCPRVSVLQALLANPALPSDLAHDLAACFDTQQPA